jgi:hypothetical protein
MLFTILLKSLDLALADLLCLSSRPRHGWSAISRRCLAAASCQVFTKPDSSRQFPPARFSSGCAFMIGLLMLISSNFVPCRSVDRLKQTNNGWFCTVFCYIFDWILTLKFEVWIALGLDREWCQSVDRILEYNINNEGIKRPGILLLLKLHKILINTSFLKNFTVKTPKMRFFLCLLALFSLALFVNATVQQRSNRRGSDNRPEGLPRGSNNRGTNNNRETNNNGPGNDNQSPPRRGGGPGQTRLRRDVGIFPDSDGSLLWCFLNLVIQFQLPSYFQLMTDKVGTLVPPKPRTLASGVQLSRKIYKNILCNAYKFQHWQTTLPIGPVAVPRIPAKRSRPSGALNFRKDSRMN